MRHTPTQALPAHGIEALEQRCELTLPDDLAKPERLRTCALPAANHAFALAQIGLEIKPQLLPRRR